MKKKILFLLIITAAILQFACKKNNGDSGMPVITSVRTVDTATRDSVFTSAVPGTMIVIQGSNMGGLQAVLFNDTSAYFNPVYATSSHIIVTIPATAQTAASNPAVKDQIKLVTDHGTATYMFTLYLPPPTISSIAFDNTGTLVYINGTNFQGIQKITFPIVGGAPDTALNYTVNKAFTQITAAIPPGAVAQDSLRVYCTFGEASFPYPPPMTVTNVSNENGTSGTTIVITGTNFVGISQVTFPGGIAGTNLQSLGVSQISVTVPAGISAPDSLRITGSLGTATAPQLFDSYITHPSPGYLTTFEVQYAGDNTGFVGWTGGYADAPTAASNYPGGSGAVGYLLQGSPMPGNTNPGSQGNAGFVQLNDVPWVANTATPIAGYSLKFEFFTPGPWTAGAIWVMMGDWYGWHDYLARYAPWSSDPSGKFQPSGWVTATVPLTQFVTVTGGSNSDNNEWDLKSFPTGGSPATKFSDFTSTALCFTIVNDQSSPNIPANTLNLAIDNVRIVKGQ
jgi:Surface glycan-binding protein B xyloglucan binding domain